MIKIFRFDLRLLKGFKRQSIKKSQDALLPTFYCNKIY